MLALELCSGSGAMTLPFKNNGHTVITIDCEPEYNPTIVADILTVDIEKLLAYGKFDYIHASPPCTYFSMAGHCSEFHKDYFTDSIVPISDKGRKAIEIMEKCWTIIQVLEPKCWSIENPCALMRKTTLMHSLYDYRHTTTYCQYGDTAMKKTDFWFNYEWNIRPPCKNGSSCHVPAPRGSKTPGSTQGKASAYERAIIPSKLCEENYLAVIKCV